MLHPRILRTTPHKNGISSRQLEHSLGVTYKTAWPWAHPLSAKPYVRALTALQATVIILVEVDETFIGHDKTIKPKRGMKGIKKAPYLVRG